MSRSPTDERFLGGLSGARLLRRGQFGGNARGGYGVFATNRRLFGVGDPRFGGFLRDTLLFSPAEGGAFSNLKVNEHQSMLHKVEESSNVTLARISEKNDFALDEDQITELELTKPGLISNGYLLIRAQQTDPVKIRIYGKLEYALLVELLTDFCPEVLKKQ